MRSIAFAFALAAAVVSFKTAPAKADVVYPWCLQTDVGDGALNCGFDSYDQCKASMVGSGGFCVQNLHYRQEQQAQQPQYQAPAPTTSRSRH